MKNIKWIAVIVLLLLSVAAGGYWLGTQRENTISSPDKGRLGGVEAARKILYYRNPMGLADTSPVPKKDSMGMDYVAVYQGDAGQDEEGAVNISAAKVQKLGVTSVAATLRRLDKTLHAAGVIAIDERRTYAIAPKFEGWVEKLYVNTSGQSVSKGQALFEVYSPELVSAQREYAIAAQGERALSNADSDARASMKQLAQASLARLKNWDISEGEIRRLANDPQANGKLRHSLTYYAPVSGVVLEKRAVQGMRFMPGETLYQIADLSSLWVLAEVAEQDIALVKVGSVARVSIAAYPGKEFEGKISFIYPTLNTTTRTVQVRVEMANPGGQLKPAMYANVTLSTGDDAEVLSVPVSAVIDSGKRQVVLVQLAEGRYAPREVRLGSRSDDYVEVLEGVAEGERVVTSANFLIDAESNLQAALSGMSAAAPSLNAGRASARQPDEAAQDRKGGLKPGLPAKSVGHQAHGVLDEIYEDGSVGVTHEPIKSLGWPGMSMDFELANSSLATGIKPGSAVSFEIVERKPGEWVITKLQARMPHEGH
ncbi:MAG: efflux RND transporter periplasmic adaptor subunit [Gallionella sp.]|nr:efflux RND transporter periplasmic adaptor subunit [Gallionella sp.]